MVVFNHLTQVVFHREHLLTHEIVVTQTTVVGDETFQDEATGRLRADALCQSDTTALGAIDEHAQGSVVGGGHIEDRLHQHTHGPHDQRGNDEHEDNLTTRQRFEILAGGREHEVMYTQGQHQRHQVGIEHTHQVDKR